MNRLFPFVQSFVRYGWVLMLLAGVFIRSTLARTESSVPQTATAAEVPAHESAAVENNILYSSQIGGYSVSIPTPISLREQERLFSADFFEFRQLVGPSLTCHDLAAKDYGAVWLVTYCDYPPEILANGTVNDLLDTAADATARFYGRVASEPMQHEEMMYDVRGTRFPGRAVRSVVDANAFDADGNPYTETLQARVFLADSRLYWVAAIVVNEHEGNPTNLVEPFLNSFFIQAEDT